MDEKFIKERITELRTKKGVSEYKMSLDLGHSKGYIQSISSGKALPSMAEFLFICQYLETTPRNFFDESISTPELVTKLNVIVKNLPEEDLLLLIKVAERLESNK